jgi:hypothetical protein
MQAHSSRFVSKETNTLVHNRDFINTQCINRLIFFASLCFDKDNSSNEQGNDDDEHESSHYEEYLVLDDPVCSGRNRH